MYHDHVGPPNPHTATEYVDIWNDEFIKMPFSDFNLNDKNQVNRIERLIKNFIEKIYKR